MNQNYSYVLPNQVINKITTTIDHKEKIKSQISNNNTESTFSIPTSCYLESFESDNDNNGNNDNNEDYIETNKIFCFNGAFTLLTIFILVLLLIFININSKKQL